MKITIDNQQYDIPYGGFMYAQEILACIGRKRNEYDLYRIHKDGISPPELFPNDRLLSSNAEYITVWREQ